MKTLQVIQLVLAVLLELAAGNPFHLYSVNLHRLDGFVQACSCKCPEAKPIFSTSMAICRQTFDECQTTLQWATKSTFEKYSPVTTLRQNGVILAKTPILWKESGIEHPQDCSVEDASFEHHKIGWKSIVQPNVFEFAIYKNRTSLLFRGSENDVALLSGTVVKLKVKCDEKPTCAVLRIAGTADRGLDEFTDEPSGTMVIVCALIIFVLVVILSTFVIWNVCWRLKKRQLINEFQTNFLQQCQGPQEVQKSEFSPIDMEQEFSIQTPPRRRLYFSSEYLEEEMLKNPPETAEQFLFDLRRMVDIAKDRLRQRRFVPMLITIPEDASETNRHSMISIDEVEVEVEPDSPRSDGTDSGRESKDDSEEDEVTSSDVAEMRHVIEESPEKKLDVNRNNVSSIVKNFETQTAIPPANFQSKRLCRLKPPTHMPPITPPKVKEEPPPLPKSEPPRRSVSRLPTRIGNPSPRPQSRIPLKATTSTTTTTTSEVVDETSEPSTPSRQESKLKRPASFKGRSLKETKGYAVYPAADSGLNKSLPRRPKKVN